MKEQLTDFEQIEVGDTLIHRGTEEEVIVERLRAFESLDIIVGSMPIPNIHYRVFSHIKKKNTVVTNWKAVIER